MDYKNLLEPSCTPLWDILFLVYWIAMMVISVGFPSIAGAVVGVYGDSQLNGTAIWLFSLLGWLLPLLLLTAAFDILQHIDIWRAQWASKTH